MQGAFFFCNVRALGYVNHLLQPRKEGFTVDFQGLPISLMDVEEDTLRHHSIVFIVVGQDRMASRHQMWDLLLRNLRHLQKADRKRKKSSLPPKTQVSMGNRQTLPECGERAPLPNCGAHCVVYQSRSPGGVAPQLAPAGHGLDVEPSRSWHWCNLQRLGRPRRPHLAQPSTQTLNVRSVGSETGVVVSNVLEDLDTSVQWCF